MGRPERDRWMERFLVEEAEAQTRILVGLRGRLERGMAAAEERDAAAVAAGKKPNPKPPSREWVRAARLYFDGYKHVAMLQLEYAKLEIARQRAERAPGAPPVPENVIEAQLRHELALAAATFEGDNLEVLAKNLSPEQWAELERMRGER